MSTTHSNTFLTKSVPPCYVPYTKHVWARGEGAVEESHVKPNMLTLFKPSLLHRVTFPILSTCEQEAKGL